MPIGTGELRSLAAMARGGVAPDPVRVSKEFEALLVGQMLKTGSKPLSESTPLSGGSAGRMYREMFLEEVTRRAALSGGFGLAPALRQQLESAPPPPETEAKPK